MKKKTSVVLWWLIIILGLDEAILASGVIDKVADRSNKFCLMLQTSFLLRKSFLNSIFDNTV